MQIQEIQPVTIGKVENGQVVLDDLPAPNKVSKQAPEPIEPQKNELETPKVQLSPEEIKKLAEQLVQTVIASIQPTYEGKLKEKDDELIGRDEMMEKKSKEFDGERKKMKMESEKHTKDMETKHKSEIKAKDELVKKLEKALKDKDKETKELLAQVKEALEEDED